MRIDAQTNGSPAGSLLLSYYSQYEIIDPSSKPTDVFIACVSTGEPAGR